MVTLNIKSTKAELLAAFEEMRMKYEEARCDATQPPLFKRQEEDVLLEKTAGYTPNNIEETLANLRKSIQDSIDELGKKLSDESKKLSDIHNAVAVEEARLVETRHLELGAQAMDTLVASYDQKTKELVDKYRLEEEYLAEEKAKKKKEWEREQEEYIYNQKIVHRKEEDTYEAECAKKEAVFGSKMSVREEAIEQKERALAERREIIANLEAESKGFPDKLEKAIRETEKTTTEVLQKEYAVEKKLSEQERKAELNMLEARIIALAETNKAQINEIKSLKDALAAANQQAQTLAATVIESVSGGKSARASETVNA